MYTNMPQYPVTFKEISRVTGVETRENLGPLAVSHPDLLIRALVLYSANHGSPLVTEQLKTQNKYPNGIKELVETAVVYADVGKTFSEDFDDTHLYFPKTSISIGKSDGKYLLGIKNGIPNHEEILAKKMNAKRAIESIDVIFDTSNVYGRFNIDLGDILMRAKLEGVSAEEIVDSIAVKGRWNGEITYGHPGYENRFSLTVGVDYHQPARLIFNLKYIEESGLISPAAGYAKKKIINAAGLIKKRVEQSKKIKHWG